MKALFGFALVAVGIVLGGCDYNVKSTRRFRLPQGNAENGKTAFVALNCTSCHSVAGTIDLPKPTVAPEEVVVLGGEVARMRTFGDLLTSIIHPNDSISEKMRRAPGGVPAKSPMPVVNDTMTVSQMVDLVSFLQPRYTELPPLEGWYYPM